MRRKISSLIAAVAILAVAGSALAQNADPNTGGPTKNTLKLRVIEPVEGATITGSSVRVTVDYNHDIFAAGQGTHFGDANFPQPRFEIYLDNSRKATLKGTESNTATIDNVPAGSHKIAVVALNVSGEVIDRKEFGVTFNIALDKGGLALADKVQIHLELEATRAVQAEAPRASASA